MSDKWERIKKLSAFDNGELIQVCFADEHIESLEAKNKELEDNLNLARNSLKAKNAEIQRLEEGYNTLERIYLFGV